MYIGMVHALMVIGQISFGEYSAVLGVADDFPELAVDSTFTGSAAGNSSAQSERCEFVMNSDSSVSLTPFRNTKCSFSVIAKAFNLAL